MGQCKDVRGSKKTPLQDALFMLFMQLARSTLDNPYKLQVWFALVGQLLAAARIVKL